jgi:hypothetical protein
MAPTDHPLGQSITGVLDVLGLATSGEFFKPLLKSLIFALRRKHAPCYLANAGGVLTLNPLGEGELGRRHNEELPP